MATTRTDQVTPEPSQGRTDRDRIMIFLGVFLVILFIVTSYVSLGGSDAPRRPKIRGPVKDPKRLSLLQEAALLPTEKPLRRAYGEIHAVT
ncbi:MAG: hypothetical protein FJY85_07380 [Deltaproteobacteria bacterium]|nr:hypothetical protein [Deltaproteobacteria bacterium]